ALGALNLEPLSINPSEELLGQRRTQLEGLQNNSTGPKKTTCENVIRAIDEIKEHNKNMREQKENKLSYENLSMQIEMDTNNIIDVINGIQAKLPEYKQQMASIENYRHQIKKDLKEIKLENSEITDEKMLLGEKMHKMVNYSIEQVLKMIDVKLQTSPEP
ncbi:MAG TPA: hypothetical protein VGE97_02655, partial [Nitrososphaera sp.]